MELHQTNLSTVCDAVCGGGTKTDLGLSARGAWEQGRGQVTEVGDTQDKRCIQEKREVSVGLMIHESLKARDL